MSHLKRLQREAAGEQTVKDKAEQFVAADTRYVAKNHPIRCLSRVAKPVLLSRRAAELSRCVALALPAHPIACGVARGYVGTDQNRAPEIRRSSDPMTTPRVGLRRGTDGCMDRAAFPFFRHPVAARGLS